MLTLVIPARTAATSRRPRPPDDPCRTRGTGTREWICAIQPEVEPRCPLGHRVRAPTATARASTPCPREGLRVLAAWSARRGRGRRPCLRSRRAASTLAPARGQRSATARVRSRFWSSPSREPSNITEVKPSPRASSTSGSLTAWSRWRPPAPLPARPAPGSPRRPARASRGRRRCSRPDLEHHGQAGLLGGRGERLRVLEVDDVEGRHPPALLPRLVEDGVERGQHRGASCGGVAGSRTTSGSSRSTSAARRRPARGCSTAAADQPRRS